jgi:acylphosphatase
MRHLRRLRYRHPKTDMEITTTARESLVPPSPFINYYNVPYYNVSFCPSYRAPAQTLVSVDFEVCGIVQGVFFPKFCCNMARSLGLKGWVRNTRKGTILGMMQGEKERVDELAMWLKCQGAPGSKVANVFFNNWTIIDGHDFRDFRVLY